MRAFLKVKLKCVGCKPVGHDWRYDTEKLQDPKVRTAFITQHRNRLQALADMEDYCALESDPVNSVWKKTVVRIYTESSKFCLGFKEVKKMEMDNARNLESY